ncbi:mechanosensitive ion channel family protein [Rhodocyclus tenuis]|uniref:Small-conductance mechanosensitive channel n=1 Tax=Rhodocyclus tenuis TaxID=1066 RepID=A0A840FXJ0_RHOTE|nr:mechanosensitive ion channel domain-containing protein [Rhodocyclus tenuis]MBB4246827.1 small-conductance mechanosensitive channel [Rhodocyclus tenuis]
MNERELFSLLRGIWRELQEPDAWWQFVALFASLAIAWWLTRLLRQYSRDASGERSALREFGESGLRRVSFPLLALALVLLARAALQPWWGHVGMIDLAVPLLLSLAVVRVTVYVLRRAFAPSGWLAASERFFALTVWLCLALYITGLSDPLIDMLEQVTFSVGKQRLDLWVVLHAAVTVLATLLIALWAAGFVEQRLLRAQDMDSNVRVLFARLAKSLLSLVALLFSLSLVGIDITALSVFGGALAVGLGFGLQKIASNYVSGFIILLDRSIRIGNVIAVDATTSGVVTQITTRYTVVNTQTGSEVIIPNEYLVSNIIQNRSFTDSRVRVAVQVQIAYDADIDLAMQLMTEVANAQSRTLADPPARVLLTQFADSGLNLELGFWIGDPEAGSANIRSDVSVAVLRAFRAHGIEIPFPQREVRLLGQPVVCAATSLEASAAPSPAATAELSATPPAAPAAPVKPPPSPTPK